MLSDSCEANNYCLNFKKFNFKFDLSEFQYDSIRGNINYKEFIEFLTNQNESFFMSLENQGDNANNVKNKPSESEKYWFRCEQNLWELIFCLFNERLVAEKLRDGRTMSRMDDEDDDFNDGHGRFNVDVDDKFNDNMGDNGDYGYGGDHSISDRHPRRHYHDPGHHFAAEFENNDGSSLAYVKAANEKDIIDKLYKTNQSIREMQIVIDWLERIATDDERFAKKRNNIYQYTDLAVSWENTLHEIEIPNQTEFRNSLKEIVSFLHPDAVYFENKSLNSLDKEDEERLARNIFYEIRCGKLDNAKKLCTYCGHDWKAAVFEGWRLFNDLNFNDSRSIQPVLGNGRRDIWKLMAWQYSNNEQLDKYDRGSMAAFCGNLKPLLDVCENWEDELWSYLRTLVDIAVESEIRDRLLKKFESMPSEYWDNRQNLRTVFEHLTKINQTKYDFEKSLRDITQCIILNNIDPIIDIINGFVESKRIFPPILRFSTYLILFLFSINRIQDDKIDFMDSVLEKYIRCIMNPKNSKQVAFYVSKMQTKNQIRLYALYLGNIESNNDQKEALKNAELFNLNIKKITKRAVEIIRENCNSEPEVYRNADISENDLRIIDSMNLLSHYESQQVDALEQCNLSLNNFLLQNKWNASDLLMSKIVQDFAAINSLISKNDAPNSNDSILNQQIHEFLSYKAFLDAKISFNKWFDCLTKLKPTKPVTVSDTHQLNFTEKVVHEHKLSQYESDLMKWKIQLRNLSETAETCIFDVLMFPNGGWLCDTVNAATLRSLYYPELVLLLYKIMLENEQFGRITLLADLIVSSKHNLHRSFTTLQLKDMLKKIAQSSIKCL